MSIMISIGCKSRLSSPQFTLLALACESCVVQPCSSLLHIDGPFPVLCSYQYHFVDKFTIVETQDRSRLQLLKPLLDLLASPLVLQWIFSHHLEYAQFDWPP